MWPPETTRASTGKFDFAIVFLPLLEQHGMNVPFEVIDGDQGLIERKGHCLGIADADQQRPGQARPLRHRQRVDGLIGLPRIGKRLADHGHNRLQVLPRGQLRDHASVRPVRGDLRENYIGNNLLSGTHHGGSRLVA